MVNFSVWGSSKLFKNNLGKVFLLLKNPTSVVCYYSIFFAFDKDKNPFAVVNSEFFCNNEIIKTDKRGKRQYLFCTFQHHILTKKLSFCYKIMFGVLIL